MRIVVVDYSGHPFQVQLSRALAGRGHPTLHLYFQEFQSPHGKLARTEQDSQLFDAQPVSIGTPFFKYSMVRRRLQEAKIGKAFAKRIAEFSPDVVIVCNCPLDCARQIQNAVRQTGRRFIFWQQDIYSTAIKRILTKRWGWLGSMIGAHYRRLERKILMDSDSIVVIAQDFAEAIRQDFQVSLAHIHVIPNWSPLDELPLRPRQNAWSDRHGLSDKLVVLYSGTIGLKHDPQKLLDLASSLSSNPDARVVVVSEGPFADWLQAQAADLSLNNLLVLPFQPFEEFPDVLGSADVTVAILEEDAGAFSVPSKILSYLCSGRPIVLSAPRNNLASRTIEECGAGHVVEPAETRRFIARVNELISDRDARAEAGRNGRSYAEKTFDIATISSRFETIVAATLKMPDGSRGSGKAMPAHTAATSESAYSR